MAAAHTLVLVQAQPNEHVAAKPFHQSDAFASADGQRGPDCATGKFGKDLFDQFEALVYLLDSNAHPRIDVARVVHRNFESQPVIGRIGEVAPRIEVAARCAADITARTEPSRQLWRQDPRADGAILE